MGCPRARDRGVRPTYKSRQSKRKSRLLIWNDSQSPRRCTKAGSMSGRRRSSRSTASWTWHATRARSSRCAVVAFTSAQRRPDTASTKSRTLQPRSPPPPAAALCCPQPTTTWPWSYRRGEQLGQASRKHDKHRLVVGRFVRRRGKRERLLHEDLGAAHPCTHGIRAQRQVRGLTRARHVPTHVRSLPLQTPYLNQHALDG